jgi:hypothetical protein
MAGCCRALLYPPSLPNTPFAEYISTDCKEIGNSKKSSPSQSWLYNRRKPNQNHRFPVLLCVACYAVFKQLICTVESLVLVA